MTPLRLTLRQLRIFTAVAKSGSTSGAALMIGLSQSATSAAVVELEHMLGLQFFDRVGKRLVLNDAGRVLLPQALALLDHATGIERWTQDDDGRVGELRIGASTTIGNYLLPGMLARFRDALPEPMRAGWLAQVMIANTAEVIRQIAEFNLDLGLVEGPCHEPALTVTPWLDDELVVVASPHDPVVPADRRKQVSLKALRGATWLLREPGSGTREAIEHVLIPHLHYLRRGIEFANSEAIKRAVAHGLGISCMSRYVVGDFVDTGALVILHTSLPPLTRRFHLVWHERKQMTPGLRRMVDHLKHGGSILSGE